MSDIDSVINTPINLKDYKTDVDAKEEEDLELDDIDPIGDSALDEFDDEEYGIDDKEFDQELETPDIDLPDTGEPEDLVKPVENIIRPEEQIKWSVIDQNNNDIVSKHTDGYVLMARPLSAKQGDKVKYVSRLSKDGKVLESGIIWINKNEDARKYLQNIADRILDKGGFVNLSMEEPIKTVEGESDESDQAEPDLGGPDLGGPDLGGPGLDFDDDLDFDMEDDIDLEDEDIDLEDE